MAHIHVNPWRALNWPNRISMFRLLLVAPFIVLLMNQSTWLWARHVALGVFLLMAFSDFLDGVLARRLNLRTRLGAILDPMADKVLVICSAVLLSLPDSAVPGMMLPNWVVVAIVGKDLYVIAGFIVIYLVTDRFRVRPTIFGKACTLGQLVMVASVLAAPDLDALLGDAAGEKFATACYVGVAGLVLLAVISYTRLGLVFIAEGQKPLDEHPAGTSIKAVQPNELDRRNTPGPAPGENDHPGGR